MDSADEAEPAHMVEPVPVVPYLPTRVSGVRGAGAVAGALNAHVWEYVLPPRAVRILLVVLPLLAAISEIWAVVADDRANPWALIASSVATNASIMAMAWRPPPAAVALLLAGALAVVVGEQGEYLTALTMSIGVVLYTCAGAFAFGYSIATVVWIITIATNPPGLEVGGLSALFVIGLLSATVGRGLRRVVRRNLALRSDLDAHEAHLEAALKTERDRIADELHDVIAHDISIAVMHARVLERTDDPETRASSQRAIVAASTQALTDTRRVLQLIHGRAELGPPTAGDLRDVRGELDDLARKLRALGDDVELAVRGDADLAGIIQVTLTRAAREAVTNIVKHAASPRRVEISLSLSRETVALLVVNSPHRPIADAPDASALGLARLRERVEVLGGTFSAGPDSGGWRVHVTLPTR